MTLSRLNELLENSPLTTEDKHNISVIFGILSHERQREILENWQGYLAKFILERQKIDERREVDILASLDEANAILDDAIRKKQEQEQFREETKYKIRRNLNDLAITE